MVLGAASAGVRVMTSSSSPGISLKTEGISYIAGSDLPCLIINVQRGGPGDWRHPAFPGRLLAGHPLLAMAIFIFWYLHLLLFRKWWIWCIPPMIKADEYRMPSMILADGMLGQMMEPVEFPEKADHQIEKPWATTGHQK